MDLTYVHAVAAFSGSASGTLATVLASLFTQRRKDRALRRSQAMSQRQELYKSFVEEASRLHADALVNEASDTSKLVNLYALIGRMRILSSDDVIEAAEKVGHLVIETYLSPNKTLLDLPELLERMDPLRRFSEACRRELQAAHGRCGPPAMPLRQYFAWVGSILLVALFVADWCFPALVHAPRSEIPPHERVNLRIHSD